MLTGMARAITAGETLEALAIGASVGLSPAKMELLSRAT